MTRECKGQGLSRETASPSTSTASCGASDLDASLNSVVHSQAKMIDTHTTHTCFSLFGVNLLYLLFRLAFSSSFCPSILLPFHSLLSVCLFFFCLNKFF